MDKELIAICDCPEIQDAMPKETPSGGFVEQEGRIIGHAIPSGFVWFGDHPKGHIKRIFLPSVSWLLREIEKNLKECEWLQLTSGWIAELHEGHSPYLSDLLFSSSAQDSPKIALLHVLMWQKGKVWKDKWVRKEG